MLSRSPRAQVLALLAAATAAASAPACTTTETTETLDDSSSSSALIVRPADFPGNTPCSDAPGAMRSYVATLIDHVNPSVPFTLPSSLPTPCSQGVRFDDVVAGHPYTVEIDGYEAFADELGPSGWAKSNGDIDYKILRSGDRHMEAKDGTDLTPRWLASCGKDPSPHIVPANTGTLLVAQKCTPFEDTAPGSTETAVEISPQDSLGTLACAGSAPEGQPAVASFDLLPQDGLPGLLGLPCTSPAFVQKYTGKPLAPGKQLTFFIDAHPAADAPVAWGPLLHRQGGRGSPCARPVRPVGRGLVPHRHRPCSPASARSAAAISPPTTQARVGQAERAEARPPCDRPLSSVPSPRALQQPSASGTRTAAWSSRSRALPRWSLEARRAVQPSVNKTAIPLQRNVAIAPMDETQHPATSPCQPAGRASKQLPRLRHERDHRPRHPEQSATA
ncbi:MAG: hypothetical protein R3F14_27410 [Polyangiaceae bacterium]